MNIPRRAAMVILAVILCVGAFARFCRQGDRRSPIHAELTLGAPRVRICRHR